MKADYSIETCNRLKRRFSDQKLERPRRIGRYDPGDSLTLEVVSVMNGHRARVELQVLAFVGGGFAGQVYRVKLGKINPVTGSISGITEGDVCAMKILIPPSSFSRFFRELLYRIGFQGPFQPQVNESAALAGALWQKFFRRGARIRFGGEDQINDVHAVFVDPGLGSCGELSPWIDGRTWRLEVDDRLDYLKASLRGVAVDKGRLGSPEYRSKRTYMKELVQLLHDMGGIEFARQYEWSTAKSQPNALKQKRYDNDVDRGLIAVDFRAGLALLPFLPMSPGDFALIWRGLLRGRLIQFDRGDLGRLTAFVDSHTADFSDMRSMLAELKRCENEYRNSLIDISHNHIRLLFRPGLRASIRYAFIRGWRTRGLIDDRGKAALERNRFKSSIFYLLGILPWFGGLFRRVLGHSEWRNHYRRSLSSTSYLNRSFRGKRCERAIDWLRNGRVNEKQAESISRSPGRYAIHLPLSILPVGLHRFLSNGSYFRERLHFLFVRPLKLYFSAGFRDEWLRDMVSEGRRKQMLTENDAAEIEGQIGESFIQKYLKSLAVHVCTLPVTQIVSVIVSFIYVKTHPGLTTAESMAAVATILLLFQITPISPGSLVRGFYVVYLVIRERNFRDYNIAVFLSFFKYIGYLAFPIQMTYRYPALARFMASHWATEAVHVVPVFGEEGALLEHWVFNLFYNWPLTLRRRMARISEYRLKLANRYWHLLPIGALASAIWLLLDRHFLMQAGTLPAMGRVWWAAIPLTFTASALLCRGFGGLKRSRRLALASAFGFLFGPVTVGLSLLVIANAGEDLGLLIPLLFWRIFVSTLFAALGAISSEIFQKDPELIRLRRK